jgi:hypothetical protein
MRTIILNGRKFSLSAPEERVLVTLRREDWAAKKSEFVEGSTPRYQNTILPKSRSRMAELGVTEVLKSLAKSRRELRFFSEHPRCHSGIFGNPRRVNAILNKVDAQVDDQIEREHEYDKQCDPGIALRERG